jgi:hypothetical protein
LGRSRVPLPKSTGIPGNPLLYRRRENAFDPDKRQRICRTFSHGTGSRGPRFTRERSLVRKPAARHTLKSLHTALFSGVQRRTYRTGRKSRRGWATWYAATGCVPLAGFVSPRRSLRAYRIAKLRDRHPDWFRDDLLDLVELLGAGKVRPMIAERLH